VGKRLDTELLQTVTMLAKDERLPDDILITRSAASGVSLRLPHQPDLIPINRKPQDESLELVRLGSHSELDF
jgi:mRNA interferase YafQ